MLGGTPDPRFHPRKAAKLSAATLAVLAVVLAAAPMAGAKPLSGYSVVNGH